MTPPRVEPVPEGIQRPLWSVMIPTFNCAKFLRQTLESVLIQAPGPDQMQIEVVDDCSNKDDPEALVREVAKGRATFHRKPRNEGAISNFNSCIQRSRGRLVHILHGDDWVLPRFYSTLESLAAQHPETALLGSRCFLADEESFLTGITKRLPKLEMPSNDISDFHFGTPLQCAGVVIRRSFYEQHGGFSKDLVHAADWEMWARTTGIGKGVVTPQVLGVYRIFPGNDTGRLMRTAENLNDRERLAKILSLRDSSFDVGAAARRLMHLAEKQEQQFLKLQDHEAAAANRSFWLARESRSQRIRRLIRQLLKAIN